MMCHHPLIRCLTAGIFLFALAHASAAQDAPRHKIGWLKIQGSTHSPEELKAFVDGLRSHGHIEGRTFDIEERYADGDSTQLHRLVSELVTLGVKVIVATSQPVLNVAHRVTQTVPIVARMSDNPVNLGLAQSFQSPGGNVTGIYAMREDMASVRLAQLQSAVPGLRKVGALLTMDHWDTRYWLNQAREAAAQKGLEIYVMNVHDKEDLEIVFAQAREHGVNGVLAFRSPVVEAFDRDVAELSNRHGLPGIFETRDFVHSGAFMSYGPNVKGLFHGLAPFVDRILQGDYPGSLAIGKPSAFELVINAKTAQALGLTVPAPILANADLVIH
jgi:putative ABC transport system substrate-binding protein